MEPRQGINKVNFRELARELDISVMTLYRVLNNVPSVRPETRRRVIDALNRHGFYALRQTKRIRVIFDFSENQYQQQPYLPSVKYYLRFLHPLFPIRICT